MPDVRNVPLDEAQQTLQDAGYSWHVNLQPNDTVPENYVINTSPPNGSNAPIGKTVELYVSSGPPPSSSSPPVSPPSSPIASGNPTPSATPSH